MKNKQDKIVRDAIDTLLNQEAPMNLLDAALLQMRNTPKKKKLGLNLKSLGIAFSTVFIIFIIILIPSLSNKYYTQPSFYQENDIQRTTLTKEDINYRETTNKLKYFPVFNSINVSQEYTPKYYLFTHKTSKTELLLVFTTRVMTNYGVHEVHIMIELTRDLYQKYDYFNEFQKQDVNGVTTYVDSLYVEGEYEQKATLSHNQHKYYILVSSPTNNTIFNYLEKIIEL